MERKTKDWRITYRGVKIKDLATDVDGLGGNWFWFQAR